MATIQHILFYDLFISLRDELKIELDFEQFETFTQLWLVQNWNKDAQDLSLEENKAIIKRKLKNLCISLWIPHQKHIYAFENKFEQIFNAIFQIKKQEQPSKKNESQTLTDSIKGESDMSSASEQEPIEPSANMMPLKDDEPIEAPEETITTEPEENQLTNYKNMFVDFSAGSGKSETTQEDKKDDKSIRDTPFVFSDDKHLPLPSRKALQLWRKINTYSHRVEGREINVKASVQKVVKEGLLYEPVRQYEKKGKIDFYLFIEHDGPMIAFQSWWQQLEKSLLASNKNSQLHAYYFNNYPLPIRGEQHKDFHLFLNRGHTQSHRFSEIQQELNKESIVLFFSDAGALDGSVNNNRIQETWAFIQRLQKFTRHLLWINPIPKNRWQNSSAAILSMLVPMVTYTFSGIEAGIKILKD